MSHEHTKELEKHADLIGMSLKELMEFSITQITSLGNLDAVEQPKMDEAIEYLNHTLYDAEWFVREFLLKQAWDFPSAVNFLTECLQEAARLHKQFDT